MTANPIAIPFAGQNLTPAGARSLGARSLAALSSADSKFGNHVDLDKVQEDFTEVLIKNFKPSVPKNLIVAFLEEKSNDLKDNGINSAISNLHDEVVLEWYQDGARCAFSIWPEDCDALYVSHKDGECIEQKYFDNFLKSSIA